MPVNISFGNWQNKAPAEQSVRRRIEEHMGGDCVSAHTVGHTIKPIERVNLQLALDRWMNGKGQLLGYSTLQWEHDVSLAQVLVRDSLIIAPVEREQLDRNLGESLDCVTRGIYLLRHQDRPITILLSAQEMGFKKHEIEILAHDRATAHNALSQLLTDANRQNVYKGKIISLESERHWQAEIAVRFHEMPPAPRDAIVLPEAVMQVIERNVLSLLQHRDVLTRSGRSTRHGVLFHGAPGVGKTLVVRYLARACPDHTVIVLTGRQLALVRESCQIARLLAPSIVILEDVDLVAEERTREGSCRAILHELLDEMDGIGTKANVIFLLTTNRPDILEPALAARPGRIDQAIEFPLPDVSCRHRLFVMYGRGLDMTSVEMDKWVQQTEGVSPAFIEELLRKTALLAAERGETSTPLSIRDEDVANAVKELVYFGGEITQKLLGYKRVQGHQTH